MPISAPTATPSRLIPFALKGTDGGVHSLDDIRGENGTLLMFICNHCPYVKGVIGRLVEDVRALQAAGIGAAAIMSNDTESYPDTLASMSAGITRATKDRPVLVFTLAYADKADVPTLQAIARLTHEHYYDATDPARLERVLGDLVTSF